LEWHLKKHIDLIVLQLGANDGLRGLKIIDTQKNLGDIIQLAQQRKIKIMLLGLRMPPNYGQPYTDDFKNMYVQLGNTYKIPTLPAFLTGVEGVATLNQTDGIHPNIQGHQVIADNVYPFIVKALRATNQPGSSD
jgi:acyl-CoA thioesterase-1